MIFGIGTDIVRVKRIEQSLKRHGDDYAQEILSDSEYTRYLKTQHKANFVAKRFAAKEAFVKALGTGFHGPAVLKNISVRNDSVGKPILEFSRDLHAFLDHLRIQGKYVSISDDKDIATAFVVLEITK